MRHPLLALALLFGLVASASADYTRGEWQKWVSGRDGELRDLEKSYLGVTDSILVRAGETIYLPSGVARDKLKWSALTPATPSYSSLAFKNGRISIVPKPSAPEIVVSGAPWVSPDGVRVHFELSGQELLRVTNRDPKAPSFRNFKKSSFFAFDPKAVVRATLKRTAAPRKIRVDTTRGSTREIWQVGMISFQYNGKPVTLDAMTLAPDPNDPHLFIPFKDATNGKETYEGGRYVEPELDGPAATEVTIDFNRSFSPSCARNHFFNCIKVSSTPLPFKVTAGEKAPPRHAKD